MSTNSIHIQALKQAEIDRRNQEQYLRTTSSKAASSSIISWGSAGAPGTTSSKAAAPSTISWPSEEAPETTSSQAAALSTISWWKDKDSGLRDKTQIHDESKVEEANTCTL